MHRQDSRGVWSSRWFHPLLGAVGIAALVLVAYLDFESIAETVLEVLLPVVLLAAFLVTSRLFVVNREELEPADVRRINRYTLAGIVFLGVVEVTFWALPTFHGTFDFLYEIIGLVAIGAGAGTVIGIASVRERRRVRNAEELERAIETSSEGISVTDADGSHVYVNSAFLEMHGHDRESIKDITWLDLTPDDVLAPNRPKIRSTVDQTGSWEGTLEGLRRDGEWFPREVSIARTREGGHVVVARDITRKQRQQERLRTLQEAVLGLHEAETEQEVIDVTVSIAQDLIGEPLTAYFRYDEDDEALVPAGISEEGMQVVAEHEFEAELGKGVPGTIIYENFESGEISVTRDYQEQMGPEDIQAPLGTTLNIPVGDHGILIVASATDFTVTETDRYVARILAQNAENAFARVDYEEELEVQNTRLEFLNSLLRHDVLNGMTIIRARGEELSRTAEDPQRRHADTIVKWADNVTDLVTRVRTLLNVLTTEQSEHVHPIDVATVIRDEVDRLSGAYPNTEFTVDVPDELTLVADEIVHDVIGNLIRNAAEHNPSADAWVAVSGETRDGVTRVVIEDNGPGVPGEAKERVFRRGETGHAKESGSGFGLFFVDTMVQHWNGDVWVEDRDEGGSRFVIELPAPTQESS